MAVQSSSKETFPEGQGSCAPRITTKLAQHGPDTRTCVLCLVAQSCPTLYDPTDLSLPARLLCPWGFPTQEHWIGLSCPPLGDLPNPGIEPRSLRLQVDSLLSEPPGKSLWSLIETWPRNCTAWVRTTGLINITSRFSPVTSLGWILELWTYFAFNCNLAESRM